MIVQYVHVFPRTVAWATAFAPHHEDGQLVLEICSQNSPDRLLRKMRRAIEQRNSPSLHLVVTWVSHPKSSGSALCLVKFLAGDVLANV